MSNSESASDLDVEGEFGELEVDPFPGENLSTGRRIPGDLINGMEDFAEAIPRVRRNDEETEEMKPVF